jgi:hypothetical protein
LLEDYQRVAEILCQLLPDTHDDPRASIRVDLVASGVGLGSLGLRGGPRGHGSPALGVEGRLSGLTLIGCRLRWPGRDGLRDGGPDGDTTTAAVALLGSPRMDYEAVIPLVEYAARAMAARG